MFQVGIVVGDFHVGFSENVQEVAYTEGILAEEVEDSQACHVAQATVYLAEFIGIHGKEYTHKGIFLKGNIIAKCTYIRP